MAIQNKYVNAQIVAGRTAGTLAAQGSKTISLVTTFEVAAADDDTSVFRVFPSVPASLVPISLRIS